MIPATPPMAPIWMRCWTGSRPATGTTASPANATSPGTVMAQNRVDIEATRYRSPSSAPIDVAASAIATRLAATTGPGRLVVSACIRTSAALLGLLLLVDVGQDVVEEAGRARRFLTRCDRRLRARVGDERRVGIGDHRGVGPAG